MSGADRRQVTVHFTRPGKGTSKHVEGLVSDDGHCLHTYTVLPGRIAAHLTAGMRAGGYIGAGQRLAAVRKHYFYTEYFNVIEYLGPGDQLLGYYSDIATPLRCEQGAYYLTDLFLDLWLAPGQPARELDEDEFAEAVAQGLLSAEWQAEAQRAFERLRQEAAVGVYPSRYVR